MSNYVFISSYKSYFDKSMGSFHPGIKTMISESVSPRGDRQTDSRFAGGDIRTVPSTPSSFWLPESNLMINSVFLRSPKASVLKRLADRNADDTCVSRRERLGGGDVGGINKKGEPEI